MCIFKGQISGFHTFFTGNRLATFSLSSKGGSNLARVRKRGIIDQPMVTVNA